MYLWDVSVYGWLLCDVKDDKNQLRRAGYTVVAEPHGRWSHTGHGDHAEGEHGRNDVQKIILFACPTSGADDGADALYHEEKRTHEGQDVAGHEARMLGSDGLRIGHSIHFGDNLGRDEVSKADEAEDEGDDGGNFS